MYQRAKNYTFERPWLKRTVAVFIVIFGVLGIVLPGLPGILFLIIGLELLGIRFLFIDKMLGREPAPLAVTAEEP